MSECPSLNPRRTVDPVPFPEAPSTVGDTGAYQPAGSAGPYRPAPPADAPSIPDYRITAEIARGGMGRVYAGHDLTLDREVALKTLLPGADAERFVTEAKITARLPHPGIPPVYALEAAKRGWTRARSGLAWTRCKSHQPCPPARMAIPGARIERHQPLSASWHPAAP